MTDPAPVLRREVYALIETQIATLKQTRPSSELELPQFRVRSEKIHALFQAVDLSKSLPGEPIRGRDVTQAGDDSRVTAIAAEYSVPTSHCFVLGSLI